MLFLQMMYHVYQVGTGISRFSIYKNLHENLGHKHGEDVPTTELLARMKDADDTQKTNRTWRLNLQSQEDVYKAAGGVLSVMM